MSDDDQYDPMIQWVIQEVIDAITSTKPTVYSDEQWLSLYDTINERNDCAEQKYREYLEGLKV